MTLPAMDVAGRVERLRTSIDGAGCDALLVTHLTNIRYLTGFTGSAAFLLVRPDGLTFVTDGRYEEQSAAQLAAAGVTADVVIGRSQALQREALAGVAATTGRLGLEAEHVSWAEQQRYATEWFPERRAGGLDRAGGGPAAGEGRRARSLASRRPAASPTRRWRWWRPGSRTARPKRSSLVELDTEMRRQGADDLSFETIVAAGPNGSRPHHSPSGRAIERGDLVVIDFGALVDGYHSDMTRTVPVGGPDALDETQTRMVEVVRASQAAGVAAVRAGVGTKAVDTACREVIAEAGWGDAFVHGTGHGVGLDIHEGPRVSWDADAMLAPGHVVTVEPGVYLPGHGGVRIEDTVVVTESGCRTLTRAPKS